MCSSTSNVSIWLVRCRTRGIAQIVCKSSASARAMGSLQVEVTKRGAENEDSKKQ